MNFFRLMHLIRYTRRNARRLLLALLLLASALFVAPAQANTCAPAATQGAAPADYQTYCWLDFTGYSDAAAQAGQAFSFTLSDGSVLNLTLTVSGNTTASPLLKVTGVPTYSGAAFGNAGFDSIPGSPVFYEVQSGSTVTVTLSNIKITPVGGGTSPAYAIIAADGESTNSPETLTFTTNGTAWQQAAMLANTGAVGPTVAGVGTGTVVETGTGNGNTNAYVFASIGNPTTVTSILKGSGLQGALFGLRFASLTVTNQFNTARVNATDQVTYSITSSAGSTLASGTSTGTGSGPFPAASKPITSSSALTVLQAMATGSTSTLANYAPSLTCTNAGSSSTVLPKNAAVSSYTFPSLAYGDSISCVFTDTPYPNITGTVYNDANHNAALDNGETGTGLTGLYVKLAPLSGGTCQSPATYAAAVTAASGVYTQPGIAPGTYCLIESNNSTLTDITATAPSGWVRTQAPSGITNVTQTSTALTLQNFGLFHGSALSALVFADTGIGIGGTPNDGLQNGTEAGLPNVTVQAVNAGSTIASAVTNGSGTAQLWLPFGTTGTVTVTPTPPSGYLATGGTAGTIAGAAYTRPSVSFTYSVGLTSTVGAFGLVPPNSLAPNGVNSAQPGTTLYYPHTFTAADGGQVTFTTSAVATPSVGGWAETLYRDTNCNGKLDAGEPQISGAITVTAAQQVCLILKEFVPASAPVNAENVVTLTAATTYTNANPTLTANILSTDTTTVIQQGALTLSKQVNNLTQSGTAGTSDNALPGNVLQYQLTLSNAGSNPLTQVVVNDATPAFTTFTSATCPATASLPAGLTACTVSTQPTVGGQGAVVWTFTGSLSPGAQTVVSYQVTIAQ
jgi:uncharacterized repeat protein (TIGR01451 family)